MRLYLVQHAEARPEDEDPARPLTEKGWQDARRVARHLAGRGVRPPRLVHSGRLRARQTADVWAEVLPAAEVAAAPGLDPNADPLIWAERLEAERDDLMLIGHLPHLRRLAARLLCGDAEKGVVAFRNAGVVCLERDAAGHWSLQWAIVPEMI
ncbi:MAG: phosphohistidine phosphatase SixA [Armatimonadota bacterium]|nr:phosphohistidine phosphatase SixA [Armatimonadota bacterium]MDR7450340.1 phosphohistidine phosphatase SixA [Armatimonadota bacterium]MDR7467077.1 phosphohistidine phosphatase SixA [Armatimonadota bacterium]MDR7493381.1 phosphohistidine phosphatase SixA [Armatimonadota bacterium]MDR7499389.1 phosphohistidine phosphatase SixA [Armatimonadota bacterium]